MQPTVPFPSAQVELGWPPLPALGREQPVSDDQRVSVPSHPDLGASALPWEQGAEEGVLGRRGWFGREDGWPWYLAQPCGFLWQLGGFDCTLWGAQALRPMGVGIGIDMGWGT